MIKNMLGMKLKKGILSGLRDTVENIMGEGRKMREGGVGQLGDGHLVVFHGWVAKCVRCEDGEALELVQNYL